MFVWLLDSSEHKDVAVKTPVGLVLLTNDLNMAFPPPRLFFKPLFLSLHKFVV